LLAVLAAAPGWRARARVVVPVVGVVALGVIPFYLVAPVDTVRAMTAVFVSGVTMERTPTLIGLLAITENVKLEIARDAPIVAAGLLVMWARWRAGGALLSPPALVGLGVACLATRLVFEISLLNYYFLAVGAGLLLLDFTARRIPVWSVTWIVATRFVLSPLAAHVSLTLTAALFLVAALVPIALGLVHVPRRARSPVPVAPTAQLERQG
jgi:hypothetical protein